MPIWLLLAMQAAGMVTDYLGTKKQSRTANYGAQLEQQGIEANIYQTRLEAEDASLRALQNLRQTVGTQIAVMSARGTNPGAGSALAFMNESINNFKSDERVRRLNQMGRENQLRAGKVNSMLTSQSENSKLWQSFAGRSINRIPSSFAAIKTGLKEGFGFSSIGS